MIDDIRERLIHKGLKITPQRVAVLEAVSELEGHPTADKIIDFIKQKHPNVATGTVYKTLETFADNDIIKKVKTEKDVMRYDAIIEKHHHLYCEESDRVEDYYDDELTELLEDYFKKKNIPGFTVNDIKLQLTGRFKQK
jgi:Fur family peroxide stress response transcriptional regulator